MKNTKAIVIFAIAIVLLAIGALSFLRGNEDDWICQDGQWVKHGNPSASQPTTGCGSQTQQPAEGLTVSSPKTGATISSPIKISGSVNGGGWSGFEGQVGSVKLLDANGKELGSGVLTATSDWTTLPTGFEMNLSFTSDQDQDGTLVFKNENASGDPARDNTYTLPVKILKAADATASVSVSGNMTVKVYFNNTKFDPNLLNCGTVYWVSREIPKTQAVARAALEELLKGPTDQEKTKGYLTNILNPGIEIQSLTIADGVAKVDFNEALEQGVGGSCRVSAIRAQISATLKQFPTIKSVIISIDGRTADILQP